MLHPSDQSTPKTFLKGVWTEFRYFLIYAEGPRVKGTLIYLAFVERMLNFRWEEVLPSVDVWEREDVLM